MLDQTKQSVVHRPEARDDPKGGKKGDELGLLGREHSPEGPDLVPEDGGDLEVEDQQRHRNGHHPVGEEDHAVRTHMLADLRIPPVGRPAHGPSRADTVPLRHLVGRAHLADCGVFDRGRL